MVEYMQQFLSKFTEPPYVIEKVDGGYRITNTFSGFSEVVRGYRKQVLVRKVRHDIEENEDGYWYVWRIITPERLKEILGITKPRE